ncbi:outer membrane lipoprotein carrier protein LolA [bacterium]|nr:outer membrane lipoprotein carrier protein LolA [bacterium]
MKRFSLLMAVALMVTTVGSSAAFAKTPSGKALIKDVQGAYKDMDSFSCRFQLAFTWAVVEETDKQVGTILMAKGDKFRYESPNQVMVTDGTTLWRYSPANQQCIVENLKEVEDAALPRELLFDYPKKFDAGEVTEVNLDGRLTYRFPLQPKEGGLGVAEVKVWVDATDYITRKMQYLDDSGNQTLYSLHDIQLNPVIPDERFVFDVPEGVKVFDLR